MARLPQKGIKPTSYAEIVENMFLGMGIEEQSTAHGAVKTKVCDGRRALLMKVLRVYNVSSILTGIPCNDPGFIRLPVSPAEFKKIAELIEDEEDKLKIPAEMIQ